MSLAMLLESVVPMLVTIFQMQRIIIVCDWKDANLDLKRNLFRGAHTIMLTKYLSHLDKEMIIESNLILCVNTIGKDEIAAIMTETLAGNNPWIIVYNEEDEDLLPLSGIEQQVYFYNQHKGSLHEKYAVNSVIVTRQLDTRHRLDDVHKRRANMQGLHLNKAINPWAEAYGVRRKKDDIVAFPSGDKFFRLSKDETFGSLEEFLRIMANELNITVSRFQRVDGSWGTYDKVSNESSGMIRSLVLHDMDMAWTALRMSPERLAAIDFLLPYRSDHFALVT